MEVGKGLLFHWWHYYGKMMYTFEELKAFENIIEQRGAERVLDVAVSSYLFGDGSPTVILMSIRNNAVDELFNSLPNITDMDQEGKTAYEALKNEFVEKISQTAN